MARGGRGRGGSIPSWAVFGPRPGRRTGRRISASGTGSGLLVGRVARVERRRRSARLLRSARGGAGRYRADPARTGMGQITVVGTGRERGLLVAQVMAAIRASDRCAFEAGRSVGMNDRSSFVRRLQFQTGAYGGSATLESAAPRPLGCPCPGARPWGRARTAVPNGSRISMRMTWIGSIMAEPPGSGIECARVAARLSEAIDAFAWWRRSPRRGPADAALRSLSRNRTLRVHSERRSGAQRAVPGEMSSTTDRTPGVFRATVRAVSRSPASST